MAFCPLLSKPTQGSYENPFTSSLWMAASVHLNLLSSQAVAAIFPDIAFSQKHF